MKKKDIAMLRSEYPVNVPLRIAAPYFAVSARQLSRLIADGREPYCSIGANIGTRQRYTRIYTERMIAYLNANQPDE